MDSLRNTGAGMPMNASDPHAHLPPLEAGAPLEGADALLILVHGRGAAPDDLAPLAQLLLEGREQQVAIRLPRAQGQVWYPQRFIVPPEANQPWLDSARASIGRVIDVAIDAGLPAERILIGGFSQGACLALDVAAMRPGRLGGVLAFAGGLIGDSLDPNAYRASFGGMPAFLGSSDPDPHIPTGRVEESAEIYKKLGADVDVRLYPNLGHTIGRDQLAVAYDLVSRVLNPAV